LLIKPRDEDLTPGTVKPGSPDCPLKVAALR
jgi:hypothetical protein